MLQLQLSRYGDYATVRLFSWPRDFPLRSVHTGSGAVLGYSEIFQGGNATVAETGGAVPPLN